MVIEKLNYGKDLISEVKRVCKKRSIKEGDKFLNRKLHGLVENEAQ